ncbi:hypothetical protein MNEG_1674 [Monoraphidium neglectum]|uniref:LysM domain-containing protein n=1 Tax=Monoraphidium neglectum TaxID=145388 RepID=A0A0D2K7U7_9CHLO|nr:hypothetical protein MNEG_1674 [Monoraphidium neglectum]KIZ06293.1 hypothetical protein MNEG_1674 [Monoraphidium neglectum]|eukprot:XP_013905312.1 hypothetical protein MNEG_1674 [Monoraphidium neglectum]
MIYGSYKATQFRAMLMRARGRSRQEIKERLWDSQHEWAGRQMYKLCIDLRGFYLKVPPMTADRTAEVLKRELGVDDLGELFEWIDLESPLGSASISQVHKAELRRFSPAQLRQFSRQRRGRARRVALLPGDTAWSVCNDAGVSLAELAAANRGVDLEALGAGDVVRVPEVLALQEFQDSHLAGRLLGSEEVEDDGAGGAGGWGGSSSSSSESEGIGWIGGTSSGWGSSSDGDRRRGASVADDTLLGGITGGAVGPLGGLGRLLDGLRRAVPGARLAPEREERPIASGAAAAVAHAVAVGSVPRSGLVAVKVQYPDALQVMTEDLINLRAISAFLSKTELKFDLVSAVDELQKQIHLEEARVMDAIATHLAPITSRVAVPRSVPGLVTQRVMAMTFMEGTPLMQLQDKVAHLPKWQRDK